MIFWIYRSYQTIARGPLEATETKAHQELS